MPFSELFVSLCRALINIQQIIILDHCHESIHSLLTSKDIKNTTSYSHCNTSYAFNMSLNTFSSSIILNLHLLHHLSGWYFLANAMYLILISLSNVPSATFSISAAFDLDIFTIASMSLPGDILYLAFSGTLYGNEWLVWLLSRLLPNGLLCSELSSDDISYSKLLCSRLSFLLTIFINSLSSLVYPIHSYVFPLPLIPGIIVLRPSTKASLIVQNGLPLYLLPTFVTVISWGEYLLPSSRTILLRNKSCLLLYMLHTSSIYQNHCQIVEFLFFSSITRLILIPIMWHITLW